MQSLAALAYADAPRQFQRTRFIYVTGVAY